MFTEVLVWATAPAMPRPMGKRISVIPTPCATFDHNSPRSRSTRKSVQRSASTVRRAAPTISWSNRSRSRAATSAFAASRMPPSFSTRWRSLSIILRADRAYHSNGMDRKCAPSQPEKPARFVVTLGLDVEPRQGGGLGVALVERGVFADRDLAAGRLHPQGRVLAVVGEHAAADGGEGVDARFVQGLLLRFELG